MHYLLVILGVFIALAGIGSIAAGAPSWVLGLGLGSSLIQSGAIGVVGGFLLVGIGFVLRALQEMSRRIDTLGLAPEAAARPPSAAAPARVPAKRESAPAPAAAPGLARREPPSFARREEPQEAEPARDDEDDRDDFLEPGERPQPRSWPPVTEPRRAERPPERPFSNERADAERRRERPRFTPERPLAAGRYEDSEPPPPVRNGAAGASTTVVRSGIIGGMAYTLYTDGSIEAELPIGTVRFASIEELQDHVSQTGEDADVDFGGSNSPKN